MVILAVLSTKVKLTDDEICQWHYSTSVGPVLLLFQYMEAVLMDTDLENLYPLQI